MERVRALSKQSQHKKRGHGLPGKGHKKLGGRKVGTPNKVSRLLKDNILEAMEKMGFPKYTKKGKRVVWESTGEGGAVGYLMWLMTRDTSTFGGLASKCIAIQLNAKLEGAVRHEHDVYHRISTEDLSKLTVVELTAMYREAVTMPDNAPLRLVDQSDQQQDEEAA